MSRRLTQHVRRMVQGGADKDTIRTEVQHLFPDRGQRTEAKALRVVSRFLHGRPKKP